MIIPPELQPLPVAPEDRAGSAAGEDFVSETVVRQLLVGPMGITGRPTRMFCDADGFAGRDDFQPVSDSPFIALAADPAYDPTPIERVAPGGVHPALTTPRRRPKPPQRAGEVERDFQRTRGSNRWWMLGLSAAISTLLVSGGLVELVSTLASRQVTPVSEARHGSVSVAAPASPTSVEIDRTIAAAVTRNDPR